MAESEPLGSVACVYCGRDVADPEDVPGPEDEAGWERCAREHEEWCEWLLTRSHTGFDRIQPDVRTFAG